MLRRKILIDFYFYFFCTFSLITVLAHLHFETCCKFITLWYTEKPITNIPIAILIRF